MCKKVQGHNLDMIKVMFVSVLSDRGSELASAGFPANRESRFDSNTDIDLDNFDASTRIERWSYVFLVFLYIMFSTQ